jgi:DNA-binding transcriptional LysR family regulator
VVTPVFFLYRRQKAQGAHKLQVHNSECAKGESLGSISLIPVTAPGHPLASLEFPIPLNTLRKHIHLIVSDSAIARQPIDVMLIDAEQCWFFPDFYSRLEGLRAGLGFAWMPTYFVEQDIANGRLTPIVVEGKSVFEYEVGVLCRHTPELGPTGRLLKDLIEMSKQILPDAPTDLTSTYVS